MRRKFYEWLAGACVLAAYSLATLPLLLRYPPIWPDEVGFSTVVASLLRRGYFSCELLTGLIPGMDHYYYGSPPLYFLVLAPILGVSEPRNYLLEMRLVSWVLGLVFLILSALILRRIAGNSWVIWAALILLATHITFIQAANIGRMEMLTLVCGGASIVSYLRAADSGTWKRWALAGLAGGLAVISHPPGAFILAALVLHRLVTVGLRFFREREGLAFLFCTAAPVLFSLAYAAQAPHIFVSQVEGQFVRKAAETSAWLHPRALLSDLLYPVRFGPSLNSGHDWGFVAVAIVVAGLYFMQAQRQEWFCLIAFWTLSGLALNLLVHEMWYPLYFAVPLIILLGGCAAPVCPRVVRVLAMTVIVAGILGNALQISILHGNEYLTWKEYREYCSRITAVVPAGSSVLLLAVPDPYFGMIMEGKHYRFHGYVAAGVPVDPNLVERMLNDTDYVLEVGWWRPLQLDNYIHAHGTLVTEFEISGHPWPDLRVWRLRKTDSRQHGVALQAFPLDEPLRGPSRKRPFSPPPKQP